MQLYIVFGCLALAVQLCSAGLLGSLHYGLPPFHRDVQTIRIIQQQEGSRCADLINIFCPPAEQNHLQYVHQPPQTSDVKYVNIIQDPPMEYTRFVEEQLQQKQSQGNYKTLEVVHKQPADDIKAIQIIRQEPITTGSGGSDDDEKNTGDAFKTLKSLKVYGAFEGNGRVRDSYGLPIVRTWRHISR